MKSLAQANHEDIKDFETFYQTLQHSVLSNKPAEQNPAASLSSSEYIYESTRVFPSEMCSLHHVVPPNYYGES